MAPEVTIIDALPEHVGILKHNLRPADANEILRFGVSIQHALWRSYRNALYRKTALINDIPVAMWGVQGEMLGNTGQVWLMTSPDIYKVSPLKFTRIYQQEVYKMLKLFPILENWVDSGYEAAIRLLEIVGFEVEEPEPKGWNMAMFRRFSIGGISAI